MRTKRNRWRLNLNEKEEKIPIQLHVKGGSEVFPYLVRWKEAMYTYRIQTTVWHCMSTWVFAEPCVMQGRTLCWGFISTWSGCRTGSDVSIRNNFDISKGKQFFGDIMLKNIGNGVQILCGLISVWILSVHGLSFQFLFSGLRTAGNSASPVRPWEIPAFATSTLQISSSFFLSQWRLMTWNSFMWQLYNSLYLRVLKRVSKSNVPWSILTLASPKKPKKQIFFF